MNIYIYILRARQGKEIREFGWIQPEHTPTSKSTIGPRPSDSNSNSNSNSDSNSNNTYNNDNNSNNNDNTYTNDNNDNSALVSEKGEVLLSRRREHMVDVNMVLA